MASVAQRDSRWSRNASGTRAELRGFPGFPSWVGTATRGKKPLLFNDILKLRGGKVLLSVSLFKSCFSKCLNGTELKGEGTPEC